MGIRNAPERDTIERHIERSGVDRRDFIAFCGKLMVAAPFGLGITSFISVEAVAKEVGRIRRPSVIWLHMQDCTGCTETLLRTSQPDLATLLFDIVSLDYHETVMAASGHDAELALRDAMAQNDGKYVLVVEGSIPTKDAGIYLKVGGKWGTDLLREVAAHSAAVISMGSCASFGGVSSAGPNPTGASGVDALVSNKPIVNIPGCPPNPYVLLGTVLQFARAGTLPALDALKRPKFAYDRTIHEHCPRRAHFDNGRFAKQFGDESHRKGYCLYELGCKGPVTHASCSTRNFNEVVDAWPIGIGAPCTGCAEPGVAFRLAMHDTVPIDRPTPPAAYPTIFPVRGSFSPMATGVAGVVGGAIVGAAVMVSKRIGESGVDDEPTDRKE